MRLLPDSRLVIAGSLGATLLVGGCSPPDDVRFVTMGTGGIGGNYHNVGQAIARVLSTERDTHGLVIEHEIGSGSTANIDALVAGDIEFGIAQADHQHQAVQGLGEWQGRGAQGSLRAVLSLYAEALTVVAGADSEIHSLADLGAQRVDIGPPGTGTRANAIAALEAAGLDWQTDLDASEVSVNDRLPQFVDGSLDAFFFTVGHPSTEMELAAFSVRGVRFLPLVDIDALLATNPYYTRAAVPVGLYPSADNDADVETIGVRATLLTSADVEDEVVYTVTRTVFENLAALGEYTPVLRTLHQEDMLNGLTAPLHPGARRYYDEAGIAAP